MKQLLLAAALAFASADEGWAGVFALEPGADYAWLAQKVDGAYADPGMKLVAVGVADGTVSALEGVAAEARALLEGDCADVAFGGAVGVGACSALAFDETIATTTFRVVAPDGGLLAFFAARAPTDFERDSHYLKDALGGDVEPAAELNGPGGGGGGGGGQNLPRAWRNSMLATALVLLCTFVGILGRLPFKNVTELRADAVIAYSSALAAGALLGCAVFLMLVESTHLIAARYAEETQSTWRFGIMVLAGYAVGLVLSVAFPHDAGGAGAWLAGPGAFDKLGDASAEERRVDRAFCFNVFAGDFLHNFVDGIFVAGAFLDCSAGRGWVVAGATIYHELVQEFADFFLLIGPGGLSVLAASAVNFASGVSVMLGAAIYLWAEPGVGSQGLMLAFSAGVYVYIACTEAAVHAIHNAREFPPAKRLLLFLCFAAGAVGIGLVLLDHEHCAPKDADDSGHGH